MNQEARDQYRIFWSRQTMSYDNFDKVVDVVSKLTISSPGERIDGPYSRVAKFAIKEPVEVFDLVFDDNYGLYIRAHVDGGESFLAYLQTLMDNLDTDISSW